MSACWHFTASECLGQAVLSAAAHLGRTTCHGAVPRNGTRCSLQDSAGIPSAPVPHHMLMRLSPALSPVEKVTICPPRLLSCKSGMQPKEEVAGCLLASGSATYRPLGPNTTPSPISSPSLSPKTRRTCQQACNITVLALWRPPTHPPPGQALQCSRYKTGACDTPRLRNRVCGATHPRQHDCQPGVAAQVDPVEVAAAEHAEAVALAVLQSGGLGKGGQGKPGWAGGRDFL